MNWLINIFGNRLSWEYDNQIVKTMIKTMINQIVKKLSPGNNQLKPLIIVYPGPKVHF